MLPQPEFSFLGNGKWEMGNGKWEQKEKRMDAVWVKKGNWNWDWDWDWDWVWHRREWGELGRVKLGIGRPKQRTKDDESDDGWTKARCCFISSYLDIFSSSHPGCKFEFYFPSGWVQDRLSKRRSTGDRQEKTESSSLPRRRSVERSHCAACAKAKKRRRTRGRGRGTSSGPDRTTVEAH